VKSNFFAPSFSQKLLEWYERNGRRLPWRQITDPYKIWISEIILQQTRVNQGWEYYERFIQTFPDIYSLAQADINQALKVWEGLGYYSRAINLHWTAREIVNNRKGKFPQKPEELLQLKGIGPYTANAIAAFAFGAPAVALDGNVLRIISRFHADSTPIDKKNYYQQIANAWLNGLDSAAFNNALMDLGATVCTPKNPHCSACPLQAGCKAFELKTQTQYPQKNKNLQRRNKYYHFFLFQNTASEIYFIQRSKDSFWKLLWVLPYKEVEYEEYFNFNKEREPKFQGKHSFTHFDMYFSIFIEKTQKNLELAKPLGNPNSCWVAYGNLSSIALPAPLKKALNLIFSQPALF
jgi:A/G-specific adenine glycosylase